ncbi:MAG: DUF1488 family protein [Gammaproteobacteria bacterium]|jgi:hypothetical protein|nr:DUF1488 family protein [Gammaproteobacteria bacterium]
MSLNFLNPSRSFDSTKRRINFWGYDRVREISCFVGADALKKLCPDTGEAEASFLTAFDNARERICKVAAQVYAHGRKRANAYILVAVDF